MSQPRIATTPEEEAQADTEIEQWDEISDERSTIRMIGGRGASDKEINRAITRHINDRPDMADEEADEDGWEITRARTRRDGTREISIRSDRGHRGWMRIRPAAQQPEAPDRTA